MEQYLTTAWLASFPAILAICLILRIKVSRLFDPEPRWLRFLLVASVTVLIVGSWASLLGLPLPDSAVFHFGGGLSLVYIWLRTLQLACVVLRGRRAPVDPESGKRHFPL